MSETRNSNIHRGLFSGRSKTRHNAIDPTNETTSTGNASGQPSSVKGPQMKPVMNTIITTRKSTPQKRSNLLYLGISFVALTAPHSGHDATPTPSKSYPHFQHFMPPA